MSLRYGTNVSHWVSVFNVQPGRHCSQKTLHGTCMRKIQRLGTYGTTRVRHQRRNSETEPHADSLGLDNHVQYSWEDLRKLPCLQGFWTPQYYSAKLSGLLSKCTGQMVFYRSALWHSWFSLVMGLMYVGTIRSPAKCCPISQKLRWDISTISPLMGKPSSLIYAALLQSSGHNSIRPLEDFNDHMLRCHGVELIGEDEWPGG